MGYVEGFMLPVPAGSKAAYLASKNNMTTLLKRLGATRVVECWGSDLPADNGGALDRAVMGRSGENVVLGWVEWPSREARDRATQR